ARTVEQDRPIHSLHAYFLRPGDPKTPAIFDVERIRDGKSFATRRIVVIQNGQAIFNMDASFQVVEQGLEHALPMKPLTPPNMSDIPKELLGSPFISFREDHKRLLEERPQPAMQDTWLRANGTVPDDPVLHTALLAYESDSTLLGTARLPHRGSFKRERMQMASLDHALWFHRPIRVDDWLLYSVDSPASSHSRGFTRGSIYAADGTLMASCMQEGLMRLWR
ncbi:MAG: acyl-CoA thioesterase II, partial [Pseudomonadales bacterium]|nr:acyl-CoA thioesterase II [Pseudomonadales bacterium]